MTSHKRSTTSTFPAARAETAAAPRRPSIDVRANLALLAVVTAAAVLELWGLAGLLRAHGAVMLLLIVPIVVLTPTHWGLIHEAIHSQLFASRRLNDVIARALSIAIAVPFDTVRFGHLMHHRFTREPYDQPDVYDGTSPLWRARLIYYVRLTGGLYIGELVVPLLAFMPARFAAAKVAAAVGAKGPVGEQVQRRFTNFAADAMRRSRTRRDWLATLALYVAAFWFYGRWWPALAGTMLLRGAWLSIADNLPHFDVDLDTPGRARNFETSRFWRVVTMNHPLHQFHHAHPTLPWRALSAYAAQREPVSAANAPGLENTIKTENTPRQPGAEAARHPSIAPSYFRTALRQFSGPKRIVAVR